MTSPAENNKAAEERLQAVSAALELAASDLQKLVQKMRKVLDENRLTQRGERGERGPVGPRGAPGKDANGN